METGESKKEQHFGRFPFNKSKGQGSVNSRTFRIPLGVSGPRPVQEARVFAAETVPAGLNFQARDERGLHLLFPAHEVLQARELLVSLGNVSGPLGETVRATGTSFFLKAGKVLCRTAHGLCVNDVLPRHNGGSQSLRSSAADDGVSPLCLWVLLTALNVVRRRLRLLGVRVLLRRRLLRAMFSP